MREFTCDSVVGTVLYGLVSSALLLNGASVAQGQNDKPKPSTESRSGSRLALGSFVVLKASNMPLRDDASHVTIGDDLSVKVERIDGAGVLVSPGDGKRRGWLGPGP